MTTSWLCKWRSKVKSHFVLYLRNRVGPIEPNFVCIWSVTRQPNRIIRWNWYEAVLVMQIKVKGQISFCFVSQEPLVQWAQILYAYGLWPDNHITYQVHMRPSWLFTLDQTQTSYVISHAVSLSPTLVWIPDVQWLLNYSLSNMCTKPMEKLINETIHTKCVAHPICFKPRILWDKNIHFLGSQCHSEIFFYSLRYWTLNFVYKVYGKFNY